MARDKGRFPLSARSAARLARDEAAARSAVSPRSMATQGRSFRRGRPTQGMQVAEIKPAHCDLRIVEFMQGQTSGGKIVMSQNQPLAALAFDDKPPGDAHHSPANRSPRHCRPEAGAGSRRPTHRPGN